MSFGHKKYVQLKIGNAELIPDIHFTNPYAYCSIQAFSELMKFNKKLESAKAIIESYEGTLKIIASGECGGFSEEYCREALESAEKMKLEAGLGQVKECPICEPSKHAGSPYVRCQKCGGTGYDIT